LTDSGLPVGAHLLARAGDEPTLVAIGAQLENELHWCNARPHL
jgi:Asp-tRNA(Asn)/Glu-tRNA(Gln) amidotransferase A subunit family amidase